MFKKKIFIFLPILFFLSSCGDTWQAVKKGLTNQKEKSTDEFLVKKKDPLIYPPNYEDLPTPHRQTVPKDNDEFELEKLITDQNEKDSSDGEITSGSTEQNILEKIKKN